MSRRVSKMHGRCVRRQLNHYHDAVQTKHVPSPAAFILSCANQELAEFEMKSFYVFPHMGDGGLSVGAAYLTWA